MSMPTILLNHIDKENALNNILASIALEEAGLAHIINADGEKIQAALEIGHITIADLVEIDKSVAETLEAVNSVLKNLIEKLKLVLEALESESDSEHGHG